MSVLTTKIHFNDGSQLYVKEDLKYVVDTINKQGKTTILVTDSSDVPHHIVVSSIKEVTGK